MFGPRLSGEVVLYGHEPLLFCESPLRLASFHVYVLPPLKKRQFKLVLGAVTAAHPLSTCVRYNLNRIAIDTSMIHSRSAASVWPFTPASVVEITGTDVAYTWLTRHHTPRSNLFRTIISLPLALDTAAHCARCAANAAASWLVEVVHDLFPPDFPLP
jgi:hypothetical protein